ncbi:MAG: hypothetical protein KGM99_00735 [Burkholderiales bacterium]|nr:hypothetical protein [Burkholderiales bacterium]
MKKLFFFIACLLAFDVTNLQLHIVKKTHIDWLILISLVFSIFLTGYAWYYCHKESAGKPMQNAVRQLALGLLIGAGTVIPIIAFFAVTNYIRFLPKNLTLMLFIYALIFSSGAAVFEEIAFRGFLQGCLRYFFQKPLFARRKKQGRQNV